MIFDDFSVDEAEGIILAHSLRVAGASYKKGRQLSASDIETLRTAGISRITGARLEAGDVTENDAADQIAAALAGRNITRSAAFTGRCNLFAASRGVVAIDRRRLDALNHIDEAVTVATVAPWDVVTPRQMVATIKIVPFAAHHQVVERCLAFAGGVPPIAVHPFIPHRVGIVLTTLPGMKDSIVEATAAASRARIEAFGGHWVCEFRCAHQTADLVQSVRKALAADCSLLLISGASATVDRRDVVPAAVVGVGGTVDHYGMPVDPGNLLMVGRIGDIPVIGLPGCARSPKLNGFDLVLRRVMAGLPVGSDEIMSMGVGGLLKDTADRPLPRGQAAAPGQQARHRPRLAALVLAAGLSSRMGRNKLLIEVAGKPLVAHVAEAALGAGLSPVTVVTGHEAQSVRNSLESLPVRWAHNPAYADGLASSVKAGIATLPEDIEGVLVCLGDMPALTAKHLEQIVAAFDPAEGRAICVPVHRGKRGNPVLLGREFFEEIRELSGDSGARGLIARHDERVCEVTMQDDAVLADVDTAEALATFMEGR